MCCCRAGPAFSRLEIHLLVENYSSTSSEVLAELSDHAIANPLFQTVGGISAHLSTAFCLTSPGTASSSSIVPKSSATLGDPPSRRTTRHSLNSRAPVLLN